MVTAEVPDCSFTAEPKFELAHMTRFQFTECQAYSFHHGFGHPSCRTRTPVLHPRFRGRSKQIDADFDTAKSDNKNLHCE
jgi:hypothetical protein